MVPTVSSASGRMVVTMVLLSPDVCFLVLRATTIVTDHWTQSHRQLLWKQQALKRILVSFPPFHCSAVEFLGLVSSAMERKGELLQGVVVMAPRGALGLRPLPIQSDTAPEARTAPNGTAQPPTISRTRSHVDR